MIDVGPAFSNTGPPGVPAARWLVRSAPRWCPAALGKTASVPQGNILPGSEFTPPQSSGGWGRTMAIDESLVVAFCIVAVCAVFLFGNWR